MAMKLFDFNPVDFRDVYAKNGYVHIPSGVADAFLEFARAFSHEAMRESRSLTEWAIANKKHQFLFEFPDTFDIAAEVRRPVGDLVGVPRDKVTLCERHIKVYDENATASPPPHKDRVASEITVGIPLMVPDNSYLILYPHQEREVNHFASTAQHRASLDEEQVPERVLRDAEPEILKVWPGDVVFFKGSSMYHERVNPANTSLLYLKFNTMHLDPLGEDPATPRQRNKTLQAVEDLSDEALMQSVSRLSPRLEKVSRHYSRLYWKEFLEFNIWNEEPVSIDYQELNILKALGHETLRVRELLGRIGADASAAAQHLGRIRRLIRRGAMDLVELENHDTLNSRSKRWQTSHDQPRSETDLVSG